MKNKSSLRLGINILLVMSVLVMTNGCATRRAGNSEFKLGEAVVRIKVFKRGSGSPTMINVHDDENTSVIAGKTIAKESGGRVIELVHSGRRFVRFTIDHDAYSFDPNRIFSDKGIKTTLSRGPNYSEAGHIAVKEFARGFLDLYQLDREPVIVALHNTDGGGLTIHSYRKDGEKGSASATLHASERRGPGDFFYVTDRRFFDYLKERDFNVTLQDDATVPDDGSASVYFARRGIPYINIEADRKNLEQQIEMVRVAREMLMSMGLVK
jgi:hypothetical protein